MCVGESMLGDAQGQHKATDHMEQSLPPGFFQTLGLDEIQEQAEMDFGMCSVLVTQGPWGVALCQTTHPLLDSGGVYRNTKKTEKNAPAMICLGLIKSVH